VNKILFWLLASASLVLFFADVYTVVYATHDSAFWKNRVAIIICFITVGRFAIMAYQRMRQARS
jgi:hypothetical protein